MNKLPLFITPRYRAIELAINDIGLVQTFYRENPEFWVTVANKTPSDQIARDEFFATGNPSVPRGKKWRIGFFDGNNALVAISYIFSDFFAKNVWHIELFIVATALHGTGASREIYDQLESWVLHQNGCGLRLGVADGHTKARRFWEKNGYMPLGKWKGGAAGVSLTIQLMVKLLKNISLREYFERVPNDLQGYSKASELQPALVGYNRPAIQDINRLAYGGSYRRTAWY